MKEVPLTRGRVAMVDDADYGWLSQHKWTITISHGSFYAVRKLPRAEGRGTVYMHRAILGVPPGKEGHHIDRDGLNNQRGNLRIFSRSANQQAKRLPQGSSQYQGVSWDGEAKKWRARISVNGHAKFLGRFSSEHDAARAYNREALESYGPDARVNGIGEPHA